MCIKYFVIHVYILKLFVLQSYQKEFEKNFEFFHYGDDIIKVTADIVEKCFNGKTSHNILTGNWSNTDNYVLQEMFSYLIPIQLIGFHGGKIQTKYVKRKHHHVVDEIDLSYVDYPQNNFVIFASSNLTLLSSLIILKQSIWWNHEGFFVLVNTQFDNGCKMANSFLHLLWTFNILSAVLLCYNLNYKLEMYTFNPYNNFAPKFWNVIRSDDVRENHHWTLFRQSVEAFNLSYSTLCRSLNFDKTRTLNSYTINMGAYVHTNLLLHDTSKRGLEQFGGVNGDITRTICAHLNITANVKFYKKMGYVDSHGGFHSFLKDLHSGQIDFAMNMNVLRRMWKLQTYPHETSGFCIVTLKDPVTFMEKFELVFTPRVWFILGLALIATILVLKFLLKHTLQLAVLEFLRMLLNTSMLGEPPQHWLKRIFLLAIIILTMTTNSFFQSRLSSINVAPNTNPTIDTVEDLVRSDLEIHGTLSYRELLSDVKLNDRYRFSDYPKCIKRLLKGERIACIPGCIEARFSAYEGEQFHISNKALRQFFMVFSTREDWPLLNRFNNILRRMLEAGIIKLFRMRESRFFLRDPDVSGKVESISFENMKFGFVVLVFGLLLGFAALFIEIVAHGIHKKFLLEKFNEKIQLLFITS